MEESGISNNVALAITTALDWTSSPDARAAAHSYLETIKAGDTRVLASTSFRLVKRDFSSEIRLHAFKMLQHLVRLRWDELSPVERRHFANLAIDLMSEIANPCEEWALKSQTAALVAEIVRREGLSLWQELWPSIITLSNMGPIQAELVLMMLRWLPEDITVHNEDLEGDRRRMLLRGLSQSLPEIFPLLYTLLERHYGAALMEAGRQQMDVAKQHAAAVIAAINAVNAYAEWAPLSDLAKYGIIYGCGFLLNSLDFRLHACEFFKLIAPRKRPVDDASDFDTAMRNVFEILMNISKEFLSKSSSAVSSESELEFAEYICESLVSLGSTNLQCIVADSTSLSFYLQQMLGFFQHSKLALHYHSLHFWLSLMRDIMSKSKTGSVDDPNIGTGRTENEKKKLLALVTDDICSAILETSFLRMLRKEKLHSEMIPIGGTLELWSDDFDSKIDFSNYRARLLELIRFFASAKPLLAAAKVSERTTAIIKNLMLVPASTKDLAIMESMHLALENVVITIFDGSNEYGKIGHDLQHSLHQILEGLLQQLISLKWTEPTMVEVLGHYLDALGPFLRYYPDAVGSVINKLFELLTSLPVTVKDPSTSTARRARLQICTSFIRIAKAANESLLPHMKGIADTMMYLQTEGVLLRAEQNILGEAFLIMASAAGTQQQQEVLLWLLEPLSKQWTQPEWQEAYLTDPASIVHLCADTRFMWSIFHIVTFFEKALKRSGFKKGSLSLENSSKTTPAGHPMASHLLWMMPPLLRLLRSMHSLWSPPVTQALPGEMKVALVMSDAEKTSLLGEGKHKLPKGSLAFNDGYPFDVSKEAYSEASGNDIRNWLKGIRDSGYGILGLSATLGDSFFRCVDPHSVILALTENVQYMEFRHIKQLVHLALIPLVKCCPSDLWEVWLEKLLYPLLLHVWQALSSSWSSLLRDGKAKVPDLNGIHVGSDLKVEVMEEKLLRDLTREICSLFSVLASPGLNAAVPSLEQAGQMSHIDDSSKRDLNAFAHSSMVGFVLQNKSLAVPVLKICIEAFSWTDSEAMSKVSTFCGVVVLLAISTNNVELRDFVCKDLFSAIIQGLTLESNAFISADLVGLCREIFVYLSSRDPSPRQILLSLPCITQQDFLAFEEALSKTRSPKEQKQHMKSLLIMATGNKLKALATQKGVNVITNVTTRFRNLDTAPQSSHDDEGSIGLAAIT
ncbi:ARM repeat superfamily protein [Perilla frutescens var. hirtella]|uniref:ARM repeat superfamily protein n=1 Tax=Perilla frutescens var. hirtella TaxID=608512 RepID=A0AAD4IS34_PERFH|nr:ARM repeat superfamily protein [Perilla frutescens var. hirtella]